VILDSTGINCERAVGVRSGDIVHLHNLWAERCRIATLRERNTALAENCKSEPQPFLRQRALEVLIFLSPQ
jgi:hypothetical protein